MANIKSAKKRILVINKKTLRNKMIVSAVKTEIKKVKNLIEAGDKAAAQAQFSQATKAIDMACSKGVYHKNNAANKKSKLQRAINKMA